MSKSGPTSFLIALLVINLIAPARAASAVRRYKLPAQNSPVVGSWSLTRVGSAGGRDARTIKFVSDGGQIKGTYVTGSGKEEPISNVKFVGRDLTFKVASQQLYFEMRQVAADRFEGKMTVYSATGRKTPEPVRMIKRPD